MNTREAALRALAAKLRELGGWADHRGADDEAHEWYAWAETVRKARIILEAAHPKRPDAGLRAYVEHKAGCERAENPGNGKACTCGLDTALSASPAGDTNADREEQYHAYVSKLLEDADPRPATEQNAPAGEGLRVVTRLIDSHRQWRGSIGAAEELAKHVVATLLAAAPPQATGEALRGALDEITGLYAALFKDTYPDLDPENVASIKAARALLAAPSRPAGPRCACCDRPAREGKYTCEEHDYQERAAWDAQHARPAGGTP